MSDEEIQEEVAEAPEVAESPEFSEAPAQDAGGPQEQQDVWGAFRQLPEFEGADDNAIASRLYDAMQREEAASRALQQYQSIIPVASEYLQNREAYEQWRASQSQPAPQVASQAERPVTPQESDWWNPPKLKDSHKRYMIRDEQGREVISPDAPMDARAALEDYMSYRANFAQKFLDNPQEALGPMVEKIAMERAQSIVEAKVQRMEDENYVKTLEQENKDWLFDENGNVSSEGLLAQKYIADAKAFGITGAKARWDFATKMVERDLLLANLQQVQAQQAQHQYQRPPQPQQPPPQPQQPSQAQQQMEYLRQQAMRTASRRPVDTTDARAPAKPMTFAERLVANAQEQGLLH
jgi:hypothetical protein